MKLNVEKLSVQKIAAYLRDCNAILLVLYLFGVIMAHFCTTRMDGFSGISFGFICILIILFFMGVCPFILRKVRSLKISVREREITGKKKILWYIIFFALSFILLFRWYLAYYPGAFSSDAIYQYRQALSGQYNDWKPILQTLITFTLPLKLTGRADSVVLFQIIEYSCILAYIAFVLWKYTGLHVALPALLYVLLNPVTGNIAVCPWKDVTFAMLAVLLMTFGLQTHITDGKWLASGKHMLLLVFVFTAASIVRHNAFLFTVPLLVAVLIRTERKRRVQILLFSLVVFGLIKGGLYPVLSVEEHWYPKARILGVPMTILGNVVQECPESLDEETLAFMYDVAPRDVWENQYWSGNFISVKWVANQAAIDETGIIKVNVMALRALFGAPGPALKGFCDSTDMVYGLDSGLDWEIGPYMMENDVLGIEPLELYEKEDLEAYTDFSRNSSIKYLFWYIGVINLVIIISVLGKCRFTVKEDWKRILFALPILLYNFGTMLLLSGNEFKYFYLNYPLCSVVLLILFGEKTEQDEKQYKNQYKKAALFCREIFHSFVSDLKDTRKIPTEKNKKTDLPGNEKEIISNIKVNISYIKLIINNIKIIIKRLFVSFCAEQSLSGWMYGIFMLIFSCVIVLGAKVNVYEKPYFESLTARDFAEILLRFVVVLTVGSILLRVTRKYLFELQTEEVGRWWWFGGFLLLLLLWSPYLLSCYPGILTPDSFTSLSQAKNISLLYNHIPIAYTLMVAFFARIGWAVSDANFGVFLFSLAQLCVMAGVLSYLAYWIRKKVKKAVVSWCVLLFYGLNPTVAMHSITMWKDVLFSAWIVLLCIFLFDAALDGGQRLETKKGLGQLSILFILTAFGRNNGIYVVVLCWIILLISYKKVRKKVLAVGGSTILAILLIQGPGYRAMGINQTGFAESVGIPLQQISYTVVQDGCLEEEDREFLENIIPVKTIKESYSPASVDNIKFNAEFNTAFFEENKGGFIRLYLKLFPSNVGAYIQSYLLSTSGFWKIESINWLVAEDICENDMGIYNVDYLKEVFHIDMKKNMSDRITFLKQLPITNVGIMVWLVFFFVIAGIRQKQSWKAHLALPLIVCWTTIMIATPVSSQFRYIYYYHLLLPVVCIMFFAKKKENENGSV